MRPQVLLALLMLAAGSMAQAANFDLAYIVRKGDLDGDGRMDLYVDYRPRIVSIPLDDLMIPISLTRRDIGQFALRQTPSGNFEQVSLSSDQLAAVRSWGDTALQVVAADLNVDDAVDLLIEGVASVIPGARDVVLFAPQQQRAAPAAIKNLDVSVQNFVRDINAVANDSNYFDSGWEYVRTVVYTVSLPTYVCGAYEYADPTELLPSPDDPWGPSVDPWPGLPNGGAGCVYIGRTNWDIPIDEYQFDASNFSSQAIDVFYQLRNNFYRTGTFTVDKAAAAAVKDAFSSLFGMSFSLLPPSPNDVVIEPKVQRTPSVGTLVKVGMVLRVVTIIGGCLWWNDTSDDDEVFQVYTHYSYRSQATSLAGGLRAGTYVTDEPLVSGLAALQLYSLPPKDANDTPPNAWYAAVVEYTVPRVRFVEIPLTFTMHGITVTRTGGGEAIRLLAKTMPGSIQGPFTLPPIP